MEQQILKALENVKDPDLGRDIVSLGFVKNLSVNGDSASFTIELTTPACPVKHRLRDEAKEWALTVPGIRNVDVSMTAQVRATPGERKAKLCPEVKNIIPVASGKGGVGKSTVSANLALSLAGMGAKVGVLDADVYGPSIPMILGVNGTPRIENQRIQPLERFGLKIISFGFFVPQGEAVVWRGPMLHKTVQQFLGDVDWGELDYLVVDLPPGTGDVQLSLCQSIPLTGAVVVSTPQDVALNVAQKAISMFRKLNCPILGLIENMSYFICTDCNARHEIFGHGGARRACDRLGVPFLGEIPLTIELRKASDEGQPLGYDLPAHHPGSRGLGTAPSVAGSLGTDGTVGRAQADRFDEVAKAVASQISIRLMGTDTPQEVRISF